MATKQRAFAVLIALAASVHGKITKGVSQR